MEKRTEITRKPEKGPGHLVKTPGKDVKFPKKDKNSKK